MNDPVVNDPVVNDPAANNTAPNGTVASVELTDVHVRLGHKHVLRGVNLSLTAGATVAVVGVNGCGKSTLLRVLSGQLQPNTGRVLVCGKRIGSFRPDARAHLGYAPDNNEAFLQLTGYEFLHLCQALRGVTPGALESEHAQALQLEDFARRRLGDLSLGQRKRTCLAAALAGDPDVLLLDEPTNGIDALTNDYLKHVVTQRNKRGKITLAATHDRGLLGAWQADVFELVDGVFR